MEITKQKHFLKTSKTVRAEINKRVPVLAQKSGISFVKLADDLRTFHVLTSPPEFGELAKKAGISLRKAYNLVNIAEKLEDYWDQKRFEIIGWTKLRIVAANIKADTSPKSVERWLKFAESHTARECELHLKGQPFEQETRCSLLRFSDRQYTTFAGAVLKHGAKKHGKGLIGVEKALMSIIKKVSKAESL